MWRIPRPRVLETTLVSKIISGGLCSKEKYVVVFFFITSRKCVVFLSLTTWWHVHVMYPECASQCCKFYLNGRMFYIFIPILYVIVRALYCIMKCLDVQRKMQCTYWFTCTLSIFIYSYNPIVFSQSFIFSLSIGQKRNYLGHIYF